jgi:ketosteroid isomerase-like protein
MSQENVEIVRRLFDAANRGDWETALALFAPDCQLVARGNLPTAGTYSGRDAVAAYFAEWLGTFERGYHFDMEETFDISNAVVIVVAHRGRGRLSGVDVEGRTANAYWLRDGLIVRTELYAERAEALEAVGLSE